MKVKTVILENFRAYKSRTEIPLQDFTAFIGKNDIGKSTILEALEVFFNNEIVKISKDDISKGTDNSVIRIGVEFTDLPLTLVLDATAKTSLKDEYLLNENGHLEIHKLFNLAGVKVKEEIVASAFHPSVPGVDNLLTLKIEQLKQRLEERGVSPGGIRMNSSPSIRKAIWQHCDDLQLTTKDIPLTNDDFGKEVWRKIQDYLPVFALFQADRPSKDDDNEVQDPMKLAIAEAVKTVEQKLQEIRQEVEATVLEVAKRTVEKLKDFDSSLASQLKPRFMSEPKWEGFKLSLTDEFDIPINKRGSGVRRLILLSFFRAEAERKRHERNTSNVIYAVEEPEASQHPNNQKMIAESLLDLSRQPGCQVIITTHVPGLANLLPTESLRHVYRSPVGENTIGDGSVPNVIKDIAMTLGSLPDNRVKIIVEVEGPNDVLLFRHISRLYNQIDQSLPDLGANPAVLLHPSGGTNLHQWVTYDYLAPLGYPQIHIYDKGSQTPPRYQREFESINLKDGHRCFLTKRREAENYIHHEAVNAVLGTSLVAFGPYDDVPLMVARAIHEMDTSSKPWSEIESDTVKLDQKKSSAKRRLNNDCAAAMTTAQLIVVDADGEFRGWLEAIRDAMVS